MNYNTFLERFGLNPDDFVNKEAVIIRDDNSIIYEVIQDTSNRFCPSCGCKGVVKDHSWSEISMKSTIDLNETLRIYKTRFYCPLCKKSFTPNLKGIERYSKTSDFTKEKIIEDHLEIHRVVKLE